MASGNSLNPRKLLLLSTAASIGGMERVVCGLSRELAGRGWKVRTVFPPADNRVALLEWCRGQGVTAETNPAVLDAAAPHSRQDIVNLSQFIRSVSPDVVNIHYGDNFISFKDMIAVRMAGVRRCVVSVHNSTDWSVLGRRKQMLTRLAGYFCDAIVANSTMTHQILLEASIPKAKCHVISNGVPVPKQFPSKQEARCHLGVKSNDFVISTAARLVPRKQIAHLIQAVARLKDSVPQIKLLIAGDGPLRTELEELAYETLGANARFLGRFNAMDYLYAASDVFALPSYMEGFGLVYVEAAFHGIPSIGTNVGGVRDVIVDGETGCLIPDQDVSALFDALKRLYDQPLLRQKLGEAARQRAHALFTERRMTDDYDKVLGVCPK